ncbi:MAG: Fic family protein [Bacteroidales bacterium]|nr:Fic family protein [Bacteroidales bacterium]MCF8334008.1 Fic family protein [Bacteroidales bacterium]
MENKRFSQEISIFHGLKAPEKGIIVGYGAIIDAYNLQMPFPYHLSLISKKRRSYKTEKWNVFTSKLHFEDSLYKHLIFSFKYEGLNLLFFKNLFEMLSVNEILGLIQKEPTGQYSRKIWFLYEWLYNKKLNVSDLNIKNYVPLLDEKRQYAVEGTYSKRHRIINNLPGNQDFCPLIFKTEKLENYIQANLAHEKRKSLKDFHKDILQRASAFLLLKDSKASFTIEGESPKSKRAARWGKAIGEAGNNPLSKEELLRLQQLVIENKRFVKMGFRRQGGFIGEHDRTTGEPIPEHISARWQDLEQLISGLLKTNETLNESNFDAVLAAAIIAFGFVFIHPYQDGNGRIHRYIIHHVLARKQFTQQGLIFPVSASILDHIDDYHRVLQKYSHPLLDFIDWKTTSDNNVEVDNETIDYYRYFDATPQAEFLYDCVYDTIQNIIPQEVKFLEKYDRFKRIIDEEFEMPDKMVASLVRFLEQNEGKLSKRAREKEFAQLTVAEVEEIEDQYTRIFEED